MTYGNNGSIIGKSNLPSLSSAKGVFSIGEQFNARKLDTWPHPYILAPVRSITIDHTLVPNTDQIDFPILITGTYSYLADTSNGGLVNNAYDICFYSDSACTSLLPFERVSWDNTTGKVEFWVKKTVTTASDTVIYMQYGNLSIVTDQQNKNGTWKSGFVGVWHLEGEFTDSTVSGYNLTPVNTPTFEAGNWGQSAKFVASSNQYATIANASCPNLELLNSHAFYGWVKVNDIGSAINRFWGKSPVGAERYQQVGANAAVPLSVMYDGLTPYLFTISPNISAANTWFFVGIVKNDVDSKGTGFINNSFTDTSFVGTLNSSGGDFSIGRLGAFATYVMDGNIGEVRAYNGLLSNDWLTTEYNNQSDPSTFYTISGVL